MTAYELLLIVSVPVMVVGLATAYLGLAIFRLYLASFGLVIGGLLGFLFALGEAAASLSADPLLFIGLPIVFGVVGFLLANTHRRAIIVFVGFAGGSAVGAIVSFGTTSDGSLAILLMFGVIGAIIAVFVDTWTIIISTTTTGAAMVSLPLTLATFDGTAFVLSFFFVFLTGIAFQHRLFGVGDGVGSPSSDDSVPDEDPYSLTKLERRY